MDVPGQPGTVVEPAGIVAVLDWTSGEILRRPLPWKTEHLNSARGPPVVVAPVPGPHFLLFLSSVGIPVYLSVPGFLHWNSFAISFLGPYH